MLKNLLFTVALVCSTPFASAVPIHYEGTITPNTSVSGSVGGFGFLDDDAADVDFWSFFGFANTRVTIRGARGAALLDPSLSLYFGTTTADAATFLHDASFGGLVYLISADDQIAVANGPFGDPLLASFLLPSTGFYTIAIGGSISGGNGPYPYTLGLAVPVPPTLPLLVSGGAALGFGLRRREVRT